MFKFVVFAAVAITASLAEPEAKPSHFHAAPLVAAPAIAPAVVTAQSSQVIARNYHALAAAAPLVAAPAPVVAAPAVAAVRAPLIAPAYAPAYSPAYAPAISPFASYRVASPALPAHFVF